MLSAKGFFILGVTSRAVVRGNDTMLSPELIASAADIPRSPEYTVPAR